MSSPALVPVLGLNSLGLIRDRPAHQLPTAAWTRLNNLQLSEAGLTSGAAAVPFLTPSVAPYSVLGSPSEGVYAVYFGLEKAYGFNATTAADITRVAADYTGTENDRWHRAAFRGFGVYNNGVDVPQVWSPVNLTTPLIDLPNWPANVTARVLRGYKNFLIALDITKNSVRDMRLIKWSDAADPNTLPASWDETDATRLAGELTLSEGEYALVDCAVLQDYNVIYTKNETWVMRYIGGEFVFGTYRLYPDTGLLNLGCVVPVQQQHFLITENDFVVHSLGAVTSVGDSRVRRWFFNKLHPDRLTWTQVHHLPDLREIWVLFSQYGLTLDTALIWNYQFNGWSERELESGTTTAGVIALDPNYILDIWSISDGSWDSWGTTWGSPGKALPTRALVYGGSTGLLRLHPNNIGTLTCYAERQDIIQLTPQAASSYHHKLLVCIRPLFQAPTGTKLYYRGGTRNHLNQPITWTAEREFIIGTHTEMTINLSGRFLSFSVRYEGTERLYWYEYAYEIVDLKEAL